MLPLFLVLLSFGSYCSSAPTIELRGPIREILKKVDMIQKSEFQESLKTPDNIMENGCILKTLNTFIESVKSSNANETIKNLLLVNLKSIQNQVEGLNPSLKDLQTDCVHAEQSFEDFKEKFKSFLQFINEKF
ncbi:uncharacterized protein ACDP82_010309 [Pangshura tecta]